MAGQARRTNALRARVRMLARARPRPIIRPRSEPLLLTFIPRFARNRVCITHIRPRIKRREQEVRIELRQALWVDRRERAVEHLVGVQVQGGAAHCELDERSVMLRLF